MTRDYAKRHTSKKAPQRKSSYWMLWFITLILFAVFTFGLFFLGKYKNHLHHVVKSRPKPAAVKVMKPSKEAQTQPAASTPEFDFYTMLPQKKASGSVANYELEVAVVKDFATADHLKAELTLLGLMVNVTPVAAHGQQQFRVAAGPYDNKEGAAVDQQKLKQNKIRSVLHKCAGG